MSTSDELRYYFTSLEYDYESFYVNRPVRTMTKSSFYLHFQMLPVFN